MSSVKLLSNALPGGSESGISSFGDYMKLQGRPVGRHKARSVQQVTLGDIPCFIKREHPAKWRDCLSSWMEGFGFVTKSEREWITLKYLKAVGIPAPQPLALGRGRKRAFLIVRELSDSVDLQTYLEEDYCESAAQRRRLIRRLAHAIAELHEAGFTHPDLYAKHIFIKVDTQKVQFIDLQRTRIYREVPMRQRWRDLAALDASLADGLVSADERIAFLKSYLKVSFTSGLTKRFREGLVAISARTNHLLKRRKIRAMRERPLGREGQPVNLPPEPSHLKHEESTVSARLKAA